MRITIIDANNVAHIAKHTTGGLSYKGIPTGVIFGVLKQLLNVAKAVKADNYIFCWDSRKSNRKKKYPFYKKRKEVPKTEKEKMEMLLVFQQFNALKTQVLPRMGFTNNYVQTGFEADDLIAKIVHSYPTYNFSIVSNDEDLYQLLGANCKIYTKKGSFTEGMFRKKFGIPPKDWAMVKQIAGCRSDKVPGVKGVGETRAIAYMTNKMKHSSKFYQAIEDSKNIIDRNKYLVKLPLQGTHCPEIEQYKFDLGNFITICETYGFHQFLEDDYLEQWSLVFEN